MPSRNRQETGTAKIREREVDFMSKGYTVWFTGLSGSGKSALANRLAETIKSRGQTAEVIDGDVIRRSLSKDLGFSKEDRDENIRRVGHVCSYLTATERVAIAACISPYVSIRNRNRDLIGNFVEVYCKCAVQVCAQRDPKGLYAKAFAGEIKGFTGVDDPYEEPENPEVTVFTDSETVEDSLTRIVTRLEDMGYLPRQDSLTAEEESEIRERLKNLGYL
ncbi:adenylyl-sulfate kinase [bacterium]|nr:adenylyl-sulfate kinase [candidate division CSSED10-310 bacterium]